MLSALFVAECCWMFLLQLLLDRVQHYLRQNPRWKPLSSLEICLVVSILWACFLILRSGLGIAIGLFEVVILKKGSASKTGGLGIEHRKRYIPVYLFYKTLATLLVYQGINFCLETVFPLCRQMNKDSEVVGRRVRTRIAELLEFVRAFNVGKGIFSSSLSEQRPEILENNQLITLERNQCDEPVKGRRTLNWNIMVDQDALDEMKATLGPPGGFGEMGFNVSKEGVCFEAMGVGTTFNLKFVVKEPAIQKSVKKAKKKKVVP
ncbi:hypothetical protein BGZ60DRAFT_534255 [Tricladium varicosporioides]|nr:hypothetical protein BGZ60DRAFT_534255 [Hymenoscyphus varicosporioides]